MNNAKLVTAGLVSILFGCLLISGSNVLAGTNDKWTATLSTNEDDLVSDMAVDQDGNVYIAGTTRNATPDYVVAKYDAYGVEQWRDFYDGPAAGNDSASALDIDSEGNVYVTGKSAGIDAAADYTTFATIKYNVIGERQWIAYYQGHTQAHNAHNAAYAIAVDSGLGRVYVTGETANADATNYDYTTIAYSTADGSELWQAGYNGSANGNDTAYAVAFDSSGNVYVTGQAVESHVAASHSYDYTTVKYNASGVQQWAASYNGPVNGVDTAVDLVVHAGLHIYVTGKSPGTADVDYATVAYETGSGTELWASRYNGPGNSYDSARDIALDSQGNVLVTGESVGSGTSEDYATIKYNPDDGIAFWTKRYNGPMNGNDSAFSLDIGKGDDVYVTGKSAGSGTNFDYSTIRYAKGGNEVWVNRYNGPANDSDVGQVVKVDSGNNVYVTGNSFSPASLNDITTIKHTQITTNQAIGFRQ